MLHCTCWCLVLQNMTLWNTCMCSLPIEITNVTKVSLAWCQPGHWSPFHSCYYHRSALLNGNDFMVIWSFMPWQGSSEREFVYWSDRGGTLRWITCMLTSYGRSQAQHGHTPTFHLNKTFKFETEKFFNLCCPISFDRSHRSRQPSPVIGYIYNGGSYVTITVRGLPSRLVVCWGRFMAHHKTELYSFLPPQ